MKHYKVPGFFLGVRPWLARFPVVLASEHAIAMDATKTAARAWVEHTRQLVAQNVDATAGFATEVGRRHAVSSQAAELRRQRDGLGAGGTEKLLPGE